MTEVSNWGGPPADAGGPPARPIVPQRGAFAMSEVLPLMKDASLKLAEARQERKELRDRAALAKAAAKAVRANLIVHLRVWGNGGTGGVPIKTSAERNEWADADADVQQAELDADLAQAAAINAGDALKHAEEYFSSLQGMLAIERDEWKAERSIPR